MRERRNAARAIDDTYDIGGRRTGPRNECRPAFANQLIERLARIHRMARSDKGRGHHGTAEGPAAGAGRHQCITVDRFPHSGKLVGHRADATHAICPLPLEELGKGGVGGIEEVTEHMHVSTLVHGGNFDAGHERDSRCGRRTLDLVQGRDGIVVGHAHRPDAGPPGEIDERRWFAETVRRSRVQMKIDHANRGQGGVPSPSCRSGAALCG